MLNSITDMKKQTRAGGESKVVPYSKLEEVCEYTQNLCQEFATLIEDSVGEGLCPNPGGTFWGKSNWQKLL